jgi:hypothetical protein
MIIVRQACLATGFGDSGLDVAATVALAVLYIVDTH